LKRPASIRISWSVSHAASSAVIRTLNIFSFTESPETREGKNGKKRAVVAVARKLAVLLHRLWVSGEAYEPLRNSQKAMSAAA